MEKQGEKTKGKNKRRRALRVLCVLLFCCILMAERAAAKEDSAVSEARDGVVRVVCAAEEGVWVGSAFCIHKDEEGRCVFLTNSHVVLIEETGKLGDIYIPLASPEAGEVLSDDWAVCDVLYYDEMQDPDIAVVRTREPVDGIRILPLLPGSEVNVGDTIYALGYPGAVDDEDAITAEAGDVTVTRGTVSRFTTRNDRPNSKLIQHDAVTSGGNSGGVLITEDGAAIGVHSSGILSENTNVKYNFAVSIDQAMEILDRLEIPYTIYEKKTQSGELSFVLLAAGTAAVLAAGGILFRKKKKAPRKGESFTLVAENGVLSGQSWLIQGNTLLIGREEECQVKFPPDEKGISRRHASLTVNGTAVTLMDLNSTCGTFVRGKQLQPQIPVTVVRGESFWIGSKENTFSVR